MQVQPHYPKPKRWFAYLGLALMIAGAALAFMIRTGDGIEVRDIRFEGTDGVTMSALLYVPEGASEEMPVPGILTVHGYINSREMQDGFAIEFARRGYAVLSIDQTGHGYSGGVVGQNGFGGPDGLAYLRALPFVDADNIGMEGHSMGGWTILAAAAAMPDDYKSMVLVGSSTGAPFAMEGTPEWPRNMALIFSDYDEFSGFMWGVPKGSDVVQSEKLQKLFGSKSVTEGELYGSLDSGTARVLYQPPVTHPGDHISTQAIGHAADWFGQTLDGGRPLPAGNQIWYWKEIGTALGLVGFVLFVLGVFDILVRSPRFAHLRGQAEPANARRDGAWWRAFALNSIIPALIFFPIFSPLSLILQNAPVTPQTVTTQVAIWALVGAGIALLLKRFMRPVSADDQPSWRSVIAICVLTVVAAYAALFLVDAATHTDFRFWVVAVKLPSLRHIAIAAIYVVPLTLAYIVTMRVLCGGLTVRGDGTGRTYLSAIAALSGGFVLMVGSIYGILLATGNLVTALDPLSTVIAIQFVALLPVIAIIGIFCWRRTGSYRPGAVLAGLLVTLYVVAGTATHI